MRDIQVLIEQKRRATVDKIQLDPFQPQFILRQFYTTDPVSGSMVKNGDPVSVSGFTNPVRIFENVKIETVESDSTGIPVNETKTFLISGHTEDIFYGMIFEYHERKYMTLEPVWIIKYGDKVARRVELRDITSEAVYAD
jgi:hypothetical protein